MKRLHVFILLVLFVFVATSDCIAMAKRIDMTTLMETAALEGDIKEVERLIAAGADVNAKKNDGSTALHWAAGRGHAGVVRLLIEKGADVNAKKNDGETALHTTAGNGHAEAVRLLLEKGADVSAKGGIYDNTALHFAAMDGHMDVVRLLIEKGADVNAKNNTGDTPGMTAQKYGHADIARILKEAEAAEEAAFTKAAANYRAAAVKPTLPEDARKFKVQAEFAVSRKEFESAVARYEKALDMAPWWPEGHFNRALILGELSRYGDAIKEMKKYLTLVPDAPNARAAQDKIYQWEGELR